jgi:hypothetical protein
MTPAQVQRRRAKIMAHLDKWDEAYKMLQQECQHPNKISIREGSTGNWDSSEECWWTRHQCNDCDKRWIEGFSK